MVKKTFISILLLSTFLHAHAGLNKNPQNYLSPGNIPLDKEAMIYSVSASFNSISLESIKIDKPKKIETKENQKPADQKTAEKKVASK